MLNTTIFHFYKRLLCWKIWKKTKIMNNPYLKIIDQIDNNPSQSALNKANVMAKPLLDATKEMKSMLPQEDVPDVSDEKDGDISSVTNKK